MNKIDKSGEKYDVRVVPYDSQWPIEFKQYALKIRDSLKETALRIDHIGSTAVPGLAAKPVIDIQVSVKSLQPAVEYATLLEKLGYKLQLQETGHILFRLYKEEEHLVNLHICIADTDWERSDRIFRDYLRAFPEVAKQYGELKLEFAKKHSKNLTDYWLEKGPFIVETKKKAALWAQKIKWELGTSDA